MTPETDENGNVSAAARKGNLWAGLATTVAVASILWIAYQSTVRNGNTTPKAN